MRVGSLCTGYGGLEMAVGGEDCRCGAAVWPVAA